MKILRMHKPPAKIV